MNTVMQTEQTEKKKHPLRTVLIVVCILLIPLLYLYYALAEYTWYGYLCSMKTNAKTAYQIFCTDGIADLSGQTDIPSEGTVYVTGVCRDAAWYRTDRDALLPANTVLYGEPEGTSFSYFALKCEDGAVTEAWTGHYPFDAEKLKPVTVQEQVHPVPLLLHFSDQNAVGYYKPE